MNETKPVLEDEHVKAYPILEAARDRELAVLNKLNKELKEDYDFMKKSRNKWRLFFIGWLVVSYFIIGILLTRGR